MSLITRCSACGTIFKVVTDQLKVSQGWVRCGHCGGVFDAALHLQAETGARNDWAGLSSAAGPSVAADPAQAMSQRSPEPALQQYEATAPSPLSADLPVTLHIGSTEYSPEPVGEQDDFDPTEWKRKRHAASLEQGGAMGLSRQGEVVVQATPFGSPPSEGAHREPAARLERVTSEMVPQIPDLVQEVSFLREARRNAIWHQPKARGALAMAAFLLTVLLVLQVTVQQRDAVAALEPGLKPWLQKVCAPWHCDVGPLRRIEAVVIDSSSFNKVDSDSYRLSFSIKNTASVPVAIPSLEVTVTDSQDQALVRRVLTPAQLGTANTLLSGGSEFAGAVIMQIDGSGLPTRDLSASPDGGTAEPAAPLRIAGYRVLAFYP
jgi:predicted Zn finger-like uncharacterized protein